MNKRRNYVVFCIGILIIILLTILTVNGIKQILHKNKLANLEGNHKKYDLKNVLTKENSPLDGLHILYLGSSVTNGSASQGVSFADYIAKRNNTTFVKEAVNGTTLVDRKNSYIKRLEKVDVSSEFDLVICQLSTNDATQRLPLGTPSLTDTPDTSTICGAIEYIINYTKKTWGCPVVFYTNSYYENENYSEMVSALKKISDLYGVGVIDLYTDAEFNAISSEQKQLYMADDIHPTKAGYLEWWTPKMEEYIYEYLKNDRLRLSISKR